MSSDPTDLRNFGRVIWFSRVKGYGFIASPNIEKDVYVHKVEISGANELLPGDEVEFDFEVGRNGFKARNVRKVVQV